MSPEMFEAVKKHEFAKGMAFSAMLFLLLVVSSLVWSEFHPVEVNCVYNVSTSKTNCHLA
jgi:hypothetical protein